MPLYTMKQTKKFNEYEQNKYYCEMCMDINCDGCGVKQWLKDYETGR